MKLDAPKNQNYCATIASVTKIVQLENCDNVVAAIVCGNQVIVSNTTKDGDIGVFFPVECKLSEEFLSNNNLYRKKEKNIDPEKTGYFEDKGRLRAVKFRGHKSEGLFIPLDCLTFATDTDQGCFTEGVEFDMIGDIQICEKYVSPRNMPGMGGGKGQPKKQRISRLVEGQFRKHIDTAQLKKNIHRINPSDTISITYKLHGTSAVFSNVLVKRKPSILDSISKFFGASIKDKEYGLLYSSRNVVKNEFPEEKLGYYSTDVWKEWSTRLKDLIPKGITLYGEIVGYQSTGAVIQKGYHYGAAPSQSAFYCYRVTSTNSDGDVMELTHSNIVEFCAKRGIETVPCSFHGKALDVYPDIDPDQEWSTNFIQRLNSDTTRGMGDTKCIMNNLEVPAEGCVVRVEKMYDPEPFKLKNYAFLERETKALDKGEADIEEAN